MGHEINQFYDFIRIKLRYSSPVEYWINIYIFFWIDKLRHSIARTHDILGINGLWIVQSIKTYYGAMHHPNKSSTVNISCQQDELVWQCLKKYRAPQVTIER